MKKNPLLSDTMWKDASGIIFSYARKLRENPKKLKNYCGCHWGVTNWMVINLEGNIRY